MKHFIWVVLTVALACGAKFLIPLNAMDTGWDFGHAYTILRGENNIVYNDYLNANANYLYGIVIHPFIAFAYPYFAPAVFYSIVLSLFGILLFVNRRKWALSLAVILLLVSSYHPLNHRPEIFTLLIGLLSYSFIFSEDNKIKWNILIPLGLALTMLHAANGILMVASLLATKNLLFKPHKMYYALYFAGAIGVAFLVMYLSNWHYVEVLQHRVLSGNHFQNAGTFLKYSGPLLVALLLTKRSIWTYEFGINYFLLICLSTLLGAHYYYLFILVPFILHPMATRTLWANGIVCGSLLFTLYTNIAHKYIVATENQKYIATAYDIQHYLENLNLEKTTYQIFINQHIGASLYARNTRAKMILKNSSDEFLIVSKPKQSDIAFFSQQKNAIAFAKDIKNRFDLNTSKLQQIIAPTCGKLTLQSLYTRRTDSLGLYKLTILENEK